VAERVVSVSGSTRSDIVSDAPIGPTVLEPVWDVAMMLPDGANTHNSGAAAATPSATACGGVTDCASATAGPQTTHSNAHPAHAGAREEAAFAKVMSVRMVRGSIRGQLRGSK
jgi:hypothetical protein